MTMVEASLILALIGATVVISISAIHNATKTPFESVSLALERESIASDVSEPVVVQAQQSKRNWLFIIAASLLVSGLLFVHHSGRGETKQIIVDELQAMLDGVDPFDNSAAFSRKRESVLNALMANAACHERKTLTASEIMSTDITYVLPESSATSVRKKMKTQGLRHIMVCGGSGLVGVISDRDLSKKDARTACDLMTAAPHSVVANSDVVEITKLMLQNKISCIPVVEGRRVVGVVTSTDISVVLQCILQLFGNVLWSGGKH